MPDAFPDRGALPFRRPRDAGDVLRETLAFLRHTRRELGPAYLAVVAPVAFAAGLAGGLFMAEAGDLLADPAALEADPAAVLSPAYWGVVGFGLLGSALSAAATGAYVRLYRAGFGGDVGAGALWDETKPLLLPMLALVAAYTLSLGAMTALWALPGLGVVVWLALAAWSVPYVAVAIAARAIEAESLGEAWAVARRRVAGAWWTAFGGLVLSAVAFYVAVAVVVLPLVVVAAALGGGALALAPLQVLVYLGYLLPLVAAFLVHGSLEARSAAASPE